MRKGKLITFEGTEGSGKSLQGKILCSYLKKLGHKAIFTREPGNTYIGKSIRRLLLDPKNKSLLPAAELFLYLADRAQHVKEIIEPYLRKGYIVICDRFMDATAAYQGYGRGLPLGLIHRLNELVLNGIRPYLTIILDVPLRLGLNRAIKVGPMGGDRIEREKFQFHKNVHHGYMQLAKKEPKRIQVIKVDGSIYNIQDKIRGIVSCHLKI